MSRLRAIAYCSLLLSSAVFLFGQAGTPGVAVQFLDLVKKLSSDAPPGKGQEEPYFQDARFRLAAMLAQSPDKDAKSQALALMEDDGLAAVPRLAILGYLLISDLALNRIDYPTIRAKAADLLASLPSKATARTLTESLKTEKDGFVLTNVLGSLAKSRERDDAAILAEIDRLVQGYADNRFFMAVCSFLDASWAPNGTGKTEEDFRRVMILRKMRSQASVILAVKLQIMNVQNETLHPEFFRPLERSETAATRSSAFAAFCVGLLGGEDSVNGLAAAISFASGKTGIPAKALADAFVAEGQSRIAKAAREFMDGRGVGLSASQRMVIGELVDGLSGSLPQASAGVASWSGGFDDDVCALGFVAREGGAVSEGAKRATDTFAEIASASLGEWMRGEIKTAIKASDPALKESSADPKNKSLLQEAIEKTVALTRERLKNKIDRYRALLGG